MKKILLMLSLLFLVCINCNSCAPNYKTVPLYCEVKDTNIDLAEKLSNKLKLKEGETVNLTNTNININTVGEYTAEFKIINEEGEYQILECVIYVEDNTSPQLLFDNNPITIMCDNGDPFFSTDIDPLIRNNIIAIDNYDEKITIIDYYLNDFDNSKIGSYDIYVTIMDSSGNSAADYLTVVVSDNPYLSYEKAKQEKGVYIKKNNGFFLPANESAYFCEGHGYWDHINTIATFLDPGPTVISSGEKIVLFSKDSIDNINKYEYSYYRTEGLTSFYTIPLIIEDEVGHAFHEFSTHRIYKHTLSKLYSDIDGKTVAAINGFSFDEMISNGSLTQIYYNRGIGSDTARYIINSNSSQDTLSISYYSGTNLCNENIASNYLFYNLGYFKNSSIEIRDPDYKTKGAETTNEGYVIIDTSFLPKGTYILEQYSGGNIYTSDRYLIQIN